MTTHAKILILDFGSQYTQLIAKQTKGTDLFVSHILDLLERGD